MRKLTFIFLFTLILSNLPLSADTWGRGMGTNDWDSANAVCRRIGKRLPTISELKAAHEEGLTRSWGGLSYWSSTPDGEGRYYLLRVSIGDTYSNPGHINHGVRCRR
jgi:hypothetical protein